MDFTKVFPTFISIGKWSVSLFQKDSVIKQQDLDIRNLQDELKKKNQEVQIIKDYRDKLITILDEEKKDPRIAVIISDLLTLKKVDECDEIKACKRASDHVKDRQEDWAKKACESAQKNYKKYLRDTSTIEIFHQEIYQYLEWLHKSLYVDHFKVDINKYVSKNTRTLKNVLPYRHALNYIIKMNDKGDLSTQEFDYLKEYLNFLVESLD